MCVCVCVYIFYILSPSVIFRYVAQLKNSSQVWRNRDLDISVTLQSLSSRPFQPYCSFIYRKSKPVLINQCLCLYHMLKQKGHFCLFFPSSHTDQHLSYHDTFSVEKIQNLSDSVCSAFLEKMNQVNLSCLPNNAPSRASLTSKAIKCLVICSLKPTLLFTLPTRLNVKHKFSV